MTSAAYTTLEVKKQDKVAIVYLNRPNALNSFNEPMSRELVNFFEEINKDDSVRAIVITGKGKAFCAGADLSFGNPFAQNASRKSGQNGTSHLQAHRDLGGQVALAVYNCRKPVIAALNGSAVGIGITMTLPMDIRIAAEDAKIGFVFSRRGINLEAASSFFLPRLVSMSKALEWSITGRVFQAKEESSSGLFNYVVPSAQVLPKALEIAHEIASNTSSVSIAMNKALLWEGQQDSASPEKQHLLDSKCMHWIGGQADAAEGVLSFMEKRAAKFTASSWSDMPDFFPFVPKLNVVPKL